MKLLKLRNREIIQLSSVVILTVLFAVFALSVNVLDRVHAFLDVYAKTINFQFYTNLILLYLAVLLWLIYRGWRRALSKQREMEDIILSINPDVLLVVDAENRIVLCNSSSERMLGFTEQEILRLDVNELLAAIGAGESAAGGPLEGLASEGFGRFQAIGRSKAGGTVPLEVIVGRLTRGRGRVLLLRDITERKEAEDEVRKLTRELEERVRARTAELSRAYEELKELDRTKDAFLSSVSHELRTPLTSIRSFSEILLSYEEGDLATRREFISIINSESERLTRLVSDIMDLARIDAGKVEWHPERRDIGPVIRTAVQGIRGLLLERDLTLRVTVDEDLPPILMDEDRIVQVLTNLLGNAVKFTAPKGEIQVLATSWEPVSPEDGGPWIRIAVADVGVGIDPAELPRIFDRFEQGGDTLTDKPKGAGLGLCICKEIVSSHGGRIWAESLPGRGSTFHVVLPVDSPLETTSARSGAHPSLEDLRVSQAIEEAPDARHAFSEE